MTDMEAVPNPVIYSCQILDPGHGVKTIEVIHSEGLKRGRQMAYSRSKIVDADNHARVIALVEGQGAAIGETPDGLGKMPELRMEVIDSPDMPSLWEVFGATRADDGTWALGELSTDLASPDAALHIGPQHVALEKAAMDIAEEFAGTDRLQIESWHVMFLARGKSGPFPIRGEAVAGVDGKIGVTLIMTDAGNEDRNVTSASAVFRRVGSQRSPLASAPLWLYVRHNGARANSGFQCGTRRARLPRAAGHGGRAGQHCRRAAGAAPDPRHCLGA